MERVKKFRHKKLLEYGMFIINSVYIYNEMVRNDKILCKALTNQDEFF